MIMAEVEKLKAENNVSALIELFSSVKDPEIKKRIAEVLGETGDPSATAHLIHSLNNITLDPELRLVIILALDKMGDKKAESVLISSLKDGNVNIRKAAISALKKISDTSTVEALLDFLRGEKWELSGTAQEALLEIVDSNSTCVLIKALEDRQVCRYAAWALGNTGDTKAVDALIPLLEETDGFIRESAVIALGKLNDKRAIKELISKLKDKELYVRKAAIDALALFNEPEAAEAFIKLINEPVEGELCARIARILGNTGDPRAIPPLIKAYKEWKDMCLSNFIYDKRKVKKIFHIIEEALNKLVPYAEDEMKARYALARNDWKKVRSFGALSVLPLLEECISENRKIEKYIDKILKYIFSPFDTGKKPPEELTAFADTAVTQLLRALSDKRFYIIYWKIKELLQKMGKYALPPLLEALKSDDRSLRDVATEAFTTIGESGVEHLITTLELGNKDVKKASVTALGDIGDRRAADILIPLLEDNDAEVKEAAVVALGKIGDERAVKPLIRSLNFDENPGVRGKSARALAKIGDFLAVDHLIAALGDKDKEVRKDAVTALGIIGHEKALNQLITALKDSDEDLRKICAWSLGKFKDKRAIKPLTELLKDRCSEVREKAAISLGKIGEPSAIKSLLTACKDNDKKVCKAAAGAIARIENTDSALIEK